MLSPPSSSIAGFSRCVHSAIAVGELFEPDIQHADRHGSIDKPDADLNAIIPFRPRWFLHSTWVFSCLELDARPYFKTINVNHNEEAMKISTESTRHIKTQGFEAVGRLVLEALPGNVAATSWATLADEAAWLGVLTEFMSLGPAVRPELAEHMRAVIARVSNGSAA